MDTKGVHWEDVVEGQSVPEIALWITVGRLVAAAAGTRNLAAVHSNRDFARAAGNRDMFVDTYFMLGMLGRVTLEWAGPDRFIRRIWMQMLDSNCPGDRLCVSGSIARKYMQDGAGLVDLEITGGNQRGTTTRAKTTVELPSRGPLPAVAEPVAEAAAPPTEEDIPESARSLIGRYTDRVVAPLPVNAWSIRQFCDPLEDGNPLYRDPEYARTTRYGGIVAPPGMTGCWMWPFLWPYEDQAVMTYEMVREALPELPFNIAVDTDCVYQRPILAGDRIGLRTRLESMSGPRRTRRGVGRFYRTEMEYTNQRGEPVATQHITGFRFRREADSSTTPPTFAHVAVGDELPPIDVPVQIAPDRHGLQGYVAGYVRGWAGSRAAIERNDLVGPTQLGSFSLNGFGETITVSGRVVGKSDDGGSRRVHLEVTSRNYGETTSCSSVTVVLE